MTPSKSPEQKYVLYSFIPGQSGWMREMTYLSFIEAESAFWELVESPKDPEQVFKLSSEVILRTTAQALES